MEQNRIKFIRGKSGGLSQAKLAALLGLETYKIKYAESGNDKISPEIAHLIEEKLSYNLKWVLTGEGPIKKGEELLVPPISADHAAIYDDYKMQPIDLEILEIIDILQSDLPEFKSLVLKMLRGRKEFKEGLKGLGGVLKEEESGGVR